MSGHADELKTWGELCRVHGTVARRMEAELETECGISLITYTALLRISQSPEKRLRFSALVEEGDLTKSGITRLVDRLEESGLITTEKCASDRRGSFARLTKAGEQILEQASGIFCGLVKEALGGALPGRDITQLGALLQRIG